MISQHVHVGIIAINSDSSIFYSNQTAEDILNFNKDEIIDLNVNGIVTNKKNPDNQRWDSSHLFSAMSNNEEIQRNNCIVYCRDGAEKKSILHLAHIYITGRQKEY